MYHKVYPESPTMWWVNVDNFWRQMEELRRYKVVYLDDYDPADTQQAVITFDGVYENVYTYAFPILKKFGYPFELFIVGEAIGKGNEFDSAVEPPARFANIDQLKSMVSRGGRLQWHSRTHKDLTTSVDNVKVINEELYVPESIRRIDPKGFSWFAYPHGKHNSMLKEHVKNYFSGALSCDMGNNFDKYQLNRITVTNKTCFKRTTVSLIIANYNYGRFAHEAIESALRQTVKPDEILFIDDCSTDNSMEIAERFKNSIKIVRNEKNLGIVNNFNKAVSLTKGDYICFLGADNRFRSDYIEKCKFVLDMHEDAAIAYTDAVIFGPLAGILARQVGAKEEQGIKDIFLWEFPDFNEETKNLLKQRNFIHGSSMYRRSAYNEVGGYVKSNGPEDHNLFSRMINKGWKAVRVPEFLLEYRQHSTEQANTQLNYSLELAYYRRMLKLKETENKTLLKQINILLNQILKYVNTGQMPVELSNILKKVAAAKSFDMSHQTDIFKPTIKHKEKSGMVSIVILTFNQLEYTKKCIESIRKYTPESHEIIFIDNGSKDGTVEFLRRLVSENTNYRLIENKENRGFAGGCNQGIREARGEFILLLNNDVIVTEGWLSGLINCLKSSPDAGIIGPMTNNISGLQRIEVDYKKEEEIDDFARRFHGTYKGRRIPLRRIVGFCMLFRRGLIDKIGLLDETFGTGNFEDDDLCLRAELAGFRNYIAGDVFIHHYGSRSFIGNKIDYNATMGGNRKRFNEKWNAVSVDMESSQGRSLLCLRIIERAEELYQKGRFEDAIKALIEGLKIQRDNKGLLYSLAEKLIDLKQYEHCLSIMKEFPGDDLKLSILKGYCLEGLGSIDEALRIADEALSVESDNPLALNLKGIIHYKKGEVDNASEFFVRAAERDPGYGEPYTNLGVIEWSKGNKDKAIELLERGFKLSPTIGDIASLYHSAISQEGLYERAEKVFQEAIRLYPLNRQTVFLYIDVLLRQDKLEIAMDIIEKSIVRFGIDDEFAKAALSIRERLGYRTIKKPGKVSLSLCMIVKNEEKYLAQCLESVKKLVDEMVIVDTGSEDRTKEIAKIFGARVYELPWKEDFSEARNFSLSKAEGDWILVLDADEVIAERDHETIRRLIKKNKEIAYRMVTRNYINRIVTDWKRNTGEYQEERGAGWLPSIKARFFPRDARVRFEHPVHEMVDYSLQRNGYTIKECSVPVHHYGKLDVKKTERKFDLYYELGKEKLSRGELSEQSMYELAIQAAEMGNLDEASDLWNELIRLRPDWGIPYLHLARVYCEVGRFEAAKDMARRATDLMPDRKEAHFNLGLSEFYLGNMEEAIRSLNNALSIDPEYPLSLGLLSICYVRKGNEEMARHYIEKVKSLGFDYPTFAHAIMEKMEKHLSKRST